MREGGGGLVRRSVRGLVRWKWEGCEVERFWWKRSCGEGEKFVSGIGGRTAALDERRADREVCRGKWDA